jgi:hypothetical protein
LDHVRGAGAWLWWLVLVLVNSAIVFGPSSLGVVFLIVVGAGVTWLLLSADDTARSPRAVIVATCLAGVVASTVSPTLLYLHPATRALLLPVVVLGVVVGAILLLSTKGTGASVLVVGLLVIAVTGLTSIVDDASPRIDTWYFAQQAASDLLHGRSFYGHAWAYPSGVPPQYWIHDGYPYGPFSVVLLAPARVLGDVRYAVLAATLLAAVVVWWRARTPERATLALALAATPGALAMTHNAWTEPFLLLELVVFFVVVEQGRHRTAILVLALALVTKQHAVVLLPALATSAWFGWRRAGAAVAMAFAFVLPWLLLQPRAFLHDVLRLHLDLPARADGKDLWALAIARGWDPPAALMALCLAAGLAATAVIARRTASLAGLVMCCGSALLWLNLTNKQAFFNQYWLVGSLLVLAQCFASTQLQDGHARSLASD